MIEMERHVEEQTRESYAWSALSRRRPKMIKSPTRPELLTLADRVHPDFKPV